MVLRIDYYALKYNMDEDFSPYNHRWIPIDQFIKNISSCSTFSLPFRYIVTVLSVRYSNIFVEYFQRRTNSVAVENNWLITWREACFDRTGGSSWNSISRYAIHFNLVDKVRTWRHGKIIPCNSPTWFHITMAIEIGGESNDWSALFLNWAELTIVTLRL